MVGLNRSNGVSRQCRVILPLVIILAHGSLGNAAARQVLRIGVSGGVFDALTSHPLSAARVSIDGNENLSIRSAISGLFEIGPVSPGEYVLTVERAGYAARAFRIVLSDTLDGTYDIGPIDLNPIDAPRVQAAGVLVDRRTSTPVPQAAIGMNGEIVAVTDDKGAFELDSVAQGNNLLEARRIGYAPLALDFNVGDTSHDLYLELALDPLPFKLDDVEVVVEGDRTIYALGRMRDYYRRRRSTPGVFITREDIERRHPYEISDMLRMVPGVHITQAGFDRNITIRGCTPTIYLDGMPLRGVPMDQLVIPDDVEAIEVHRGAFMPVEFMTFGSCAAVAIWTR